MKHLKFILVLVFLRFGIPINAQVITTDFDSFCDSALTQSDLNICTYEQCMKLDSIILTKNKCLSRFIEQQIQEYKLSSDTMMMNYYGKFLVSIQNSQQKWIDLRKANMVIYDYYYDGGSIRPMSVNLSAIMDAKDRIRRLDDFIELLMQGQDEDICK